MSYSIFLINEKIYAFLYLLGKYTNNICNYELLFRLFYNYPPKKKSYIIIIAHLTLHVCCALNLHIWHVSRQIL